MTDTAHDGDRDTAGIVVLDCYFPERPPASPETLGRAALFAAMALFRQQTRDALASVPAGITVLRVPGPEPVALWPLGFRRSPALIAAGYRAARDFLDAALGPATC